MEWELTGSMYRGNRGAMAVFTMVGLFVGLIVPGQGWWGV